MHGSALAGILERNAALVKTQQQIASGKRIITPADDPAGAVRALDIDRAIAEFEQYDRNSDVVTNRLTYEEQTLNDMTGLLDRVRNLTLQGANATVDLQAAGASPRKSKVVSTSFSRWRTGKTRPASTSSPATRHSRSRSTKPPRASATPATRACASCRRAPRNESRTAIQATTFSSTFRKATARSSPAPIRQTRARASSTPPRSSIRLHGFATTTRSASPARPRTTSWTAPTTTW